MKLYAFKLSLRDDLKPLKARFARSESKIDKLKYGHFISLNRSKYLKNDSSLPSEYYRDWWHENSSSDG
jgi:hypothetical protein